MNGCTNHSEISDSLDAERFGNVKILIVGDVMLDRYVRGDVHRISPEAPVAVVSEDQRTDVVGGAGNVACNARGLGADVRLVAVVGDDTQGEQVRDLLEEDEIPLDDLIVTTDRPTTLKTRIASRQQHVVRVDREVSTDVPDHIQAKVIRHVTDHLPETDVLVLSDYAKGVLTDETCTVILDHARRSDIPTIVDPKGDRFEKYRGAQTLCPNERELARVVGKTSDNWKAFVQGAQNLCRACDLSQILVTRGSKGIARIREDTTRSFPTQPRTLYDVSGAGDTVVATLAVAVAANMGWEDAIDLANAAGGWAVEQVGTAVITQSALAADMRTEFDSAHYLPDKQAIEDLRRRWEKEERTVVFTNGCFDLLHAGHVACLAAAKRMGDRLVVAVNSDASVRALKGETRPFVPATERAQIIAALDMVDAVTVFEAETPIDVIRTLRPDVLVKGGDYTPDEIVGSSLVEACGGRVATIPRVPQNSTTSLAQRIVERHDGHASSPGAA